MQTTTIPTARGAKGAGLTASRHNPATPQHRGRASGGPLPSGAAKSPKNGGLRRRK